MELEKIDSTFSDTYIHPPDYNNYLFDCITTSRDITSQQEEMNTLDFSQLKAAAFYQDYTPTMALVIVQL